MESKGIPITPQMAGYPDLGSHQRFLLPKGIDLTAFTSSLASVVTVQPLQNIPALIGGVEPTPVSDRKTHHVQSGLNTVLSADNSIEGNDSKRKDCSIEKLEEKKVKDRVAAQESRDKNKLKVEFYEIVLRKYQKILVKKGLATIALPKKEGASFSQVSYENKYRDLLRTNKKKLMSDLPVQISGDHDGLAKWLADRRIKKEIKPNRKNDFVESIMNTFGISSLSKQQIEAVQKFITKINNQLSSRQSKNTKNVYRDSLKAAVRNIPAYLSDMIINQSATNHQERHYLIELFRQHGIPFTPLKPNTLVSLHREKSEVTDLSSPSSGYESMLPSPDSEATWNCGESNDECLDEIGAMFVNQLSDNGSINSTGISPECLLNQSMAIELGLAAESLVAPLAGDLIDTNCQTDTAQIVYPEQVEATLDRMVSSESVNQAGLLNSFKRKDDVLLDWMEKKEVYDVHDGMPYNAYVVNPIARQKLVTEELKSRLECKKDWHTRHFDFKGEASNTHLSRLAMQNAKYSQLKSSVIMSWVDCRGDKIGSKNALQPLNGKVFLPLAEKELVHTGSILAVYNKGSKTFKVCFKGIEKELKPGEGKIFEARKNLETDQNEWHLTGEYLSQQSSVQTNPLFTDKEVDLKTMQREVQEGEYFLTQDALKVLSNYYGTDAAVCTELLDIREQVQKLLLSGEEAMSLIYTDPSSNHSVMVRLVVSDSKMITYLHETLGGNCELSKKIKLDLIGQLGTAIKNDSSGKELFVFSPAFVLQKDQSCCGVFSLKATRAFHKVPALDDWLKQLSQGKQKIQRCAGIALNERQIPLNEMPARLLKNSQGRMKNLSKQKLDEIVSGLGKQERSLSLVQYQEKYRRSMESLTDSLSQSRPNFSVTCKKYKALLTYEALIEKKSDLGPQNMDTN